MSVDRFTSDILTILVFGFTGMFLFLFALCAAVIREHRHGLPPPRTIDRVYVIDARSGKLRHVDDFPVPGG